MERVNFSGFRSSSSAYLRTGVWGLLMAGVVVAGLGAGDPIKPASSQPVVAAPSSDSQSGRDRSNRRNRSGGRDRSGATPVLASDPYAALRTRSIFVKGNQTIADVSTSRPSNDPANYLRTRPESALVFNGVIMVGDEANALIEDQGANKTSLVKQGDLISVGKVSAISFDDLTYEASGQSKHISIGQTLAGVAPSPGTVAVSTPSTMPGGGPGASGGSPSGAAPAPGGGSSPEEILARLKAKRNQELGIK